MENINIKRGRGRPRINTDEENRAHKNRYMVRKEWYCDKCNNGKNYTLAGKTMHRKSKKHQTNEQLFILKQKMKLIKSI